MGENAIEIFTDFEDAAPRIQDVVLGERLGYARPRKIREIIAPLYRDGMLPGAAVVHSQGKRPTAGQIPESQDKREAGRPSTEYWLDRRAALLVIMRSDTPAAALLINEVVDVFLAYQDGALKPAQTHPLFLRQQREWERFWNDETVRALCALYGHSRLYTAGGRMPGGWFSNVELRIYEHLWGSSHVCEARHRIPRPAHGSNWHQLLAPEVRDAAKTELSVIAQVAWSYADRAQGVERFWGWMAGRYLRVPEQFDLPGMARLGA